MPERVRSVIAELYRLVVKNNIPVKRAVQLPVVVSNANQRSKTRGENNSIFGFTRDLSKTGISFVVSSIHLGDRHLFCDGERNLELRIKLPDGLVEMEAMTVRYDVDEDERGFLVGARILSMSENDRACYYKFLRTLPHKFVNPTVLTQEQNI
jgi:hypothetical protein